MRFITKRAFDRGFSPRDMHTHIYWAEPKLLPKQPKRLD